MTTTKTDAAEVHRLRAALTKNGDDLDDGKVTHGEWRARQRAIWDQIQRGGTNSALALAVLALMRGDDQTFAQLTGPC